MRQVPPQWLAQAVANTSSITLSSTAIFCGNARKKNHGAETHKPSGDHP
jgi:hypothetical protein